MQYVGLPSAASVPNDSEPLLPIPDTWLLAGLPRIRYCSTHESEYGTSSSTRDQ